MLSTSRASITALSRTLQNSPSLRRSSLGIGRSVRHNRISGWMPIERSSLTECWVGVVEDEILDRVGDVRDHLDGGAEIVAAPFPGQDVLIDAPGGDVVGLGRR